MPKPRRVVHPSLLAIIAALIAYAPPAGRSQSLVNVRVLATTGEPAEGLPVSHDYVSVGLPVINRWSMVLFGGSVQGPAVDFGNDDVLWVERMDSTIGMIAREGDSAAGQGGTWVYRGEAANSPFTWYVPPVIDASGITAFVARIYHPDSILEKTSLWTTFYGPPQIIGATGDLRSVPGDHVDAVTLGAFAGEMRIIGDGATSYVNPPSGVLWGSQPGLPDKVLLMAGNHIPGYDTIWHFGTIGPHVANSAGTVAVTTVLDSATIQRGPGLFKIHGGVITEISSYRTGVPGGAGDEIFSTYASLMINDRGNVAFRGSVTAGGFAHPTGLWAERNGSVELVVRMNEPAPGTPAGTSFTALQGVGIPWWDVYLTEDDRMVFKAKVSGLTVTAANDVGVWREGPGGLELVAREADPVRGFPDGVTFETIERLISNRNGDIVILGSIAGPGVTGANNRGIWVLDKDTSFVPVVVKGDRLRTKGGDLRTVFNLFVAGGGTDDASNASDGRGTPLSATGFLAFKCQFFDVTDFREAICEVDLTNLVRTELFPVRVMRPDPPGPPVPVRDTVVEVGQYTPWDPFDPFHFTKARITDSTGLIFLDTAMFDIGDPFLIRYNGWDEPAVKSGHEQVDNAQFQVTLDNLRSLPSGLFESDSLTVVLGDTLEAMLSHATIRFHLVVSVEWPAQPAYIDSLIAALRHASNYLYDVTNGQACLGKVAIYDNGSHWEEADVRIYASNLVWPMATVFGLQGREGQVSLPPNWHGGDGPNSIAADSTMNPNNDSFYRTLAHELGHYAFGFYDEYQDLDGNRVDPFVNHGFMDYQYAGLGGAAASELSEEIVPGYDQTAQFQSYGKTCWTFFDSVYSRSYGTLRIRIVPPAVTGYPPGSAWIPGPNQFPDQPDIAIGRDGVITGSATGSNAPGRERRYEDGAGSPVPRVSVSLGKTAAGRVLYHGVTSDLGLIRLLGADIGDRVVAFGVDHAGVWTTIDTVLPVAAAEPQGTPEVVVLRPVAGDYRMLSEISFDPAGIPAYRATVSRSFSSTPSITSYGTDGPFTASLGGDSSGYAATLPDSLAGEGEIHLEAADSAGRFFIVPQTRLIARVDSGFRGAVEMAGAVRLRLDSAGPGTRSIGILRSDFPPPSGGGTDSLIRLSAVFAVSVDADPAGLRARLTITYGGAYPLPPPPWIEHGVIHRWQGSWTPLATANDTTVDEASAQISSPGYYAVFMNPTLTGAGDGRGGVIPREYRLRGNYPNPFNPSTSIAFDLPERTFVSLRIFNTLGRLVGVVVHGEMAAGAHAAEFDGSALASGVYFYELRAGSYRAAGKMVLLR